jgi:hypothetical protein
MSNFSAISWREQVTFDELIMIPALHWTNRVLSGKATNTNFRVYLVWINQASNPLEASMLAITLSMRFVRLQYTVFLSALFNVVELKTKVFFLHAFCIKAELGRAQRGRIDLTLSNNTCETYKRWNLVSLTEINCLLY